MSSLPSFFLPPSAFNGKEVVIREPDIIRQMRKVLRLNPGDVFIALDGARGEHQCVIDVFERAVLRGRVVEVRKSDSEPRLSVFLFPSLIRRERFALILEKGAELGVAAFNPVSAERSPFREISPHLQKRWEAIIREAAEVVKRGILPPLAAPQTLPESMERIPAGDLVIALSTQPEAKNVSEISKLFASAKRVCLFIGPEGDYSEEEYALFKKKGAIPFSLGPRIMRSETAAIAAIALLIHLNI